MIFSLRDFASGDMKEERISVVCFSVLGGGGGARHNSAAAAALW